MNSNEVTQKKAEEDRKCTEDYHKKVHDHHKKTEAFNKKTEVFNKEMMEISEAYHSSSLELQKRAARDCERAASNTEQVLVLQSRILEELDKKKS